MTLPYSTAATHSLTQLFTENLLRALYHPKAAGLQPRTYTLKETDRQLKKKKKKKKTIPGSTTKKIKQDYEIE